MVEVDARGLSCPIPVMKAQKAISDNPLSPLTVLVDSEAAKENVSRLARSKGYGIRLEATSDGYRLVLTPHAD